MAGRFVRANRRLGVTLIARAKRPQKSVSPSRHRKYLNSHGHYVPPSAGALAQLQQRRLSVLSSPLAMGRICFSRATIVPEAPDAQGQEKRRLKLHNHVTSKFGKPSVKKFLVHSRLPPDRRSSDVESENSSSLTRSRRNSIQSVSNFERQDADIELDDADVDTVEIGRAAPELNAKDESSSLDSEINENTHLLEQHTREEMKGIMMPFGRCLASSDTFPAPSIQMLFSARPASHMLPLPLPLLPYRFTSFSSS
eukprot:6203837-Pleurochrysis_carterae.AAC.1